jgi:hypothetical protein
LRDRDRTGEEERSHMGVEGAEERRALEIGQD